MKLNKKIIVLGGGTAGWLAALFAKKYISNDVTLIESKKLGIIGVGEGTVPSINDFLRSVDIHPYEVIANTGGTIKKGISFERWNENNDKDIYFHNFSDRGPFNQHSINGVFSHECKDYYIKNCVSKNLDLKECLWSSKVAYANKIDHENVLNALHFDTYALGDYLSTKADERGIKHIDGIFEDLTLDDQGFINQIILQDNRKFDCDFIFDCSGLSKAIIGKKLNEPFISYSDTLAMKKAIVIPKQEAGYYPYTKAIAMKYGWTFEIPLQHRIGRGYIFDSDYINESQAHDEVEQFYGEDIEVKKVIEFDAGRMKNAWVKNCVSLGLAQSFVEPLEATSIFVTTEMLSLLKHFINDIQKFNENSVKEYNNVVDEMVDGVRDFIRFHYISKRNDSEFWRDYPEKYKMSDYLAWIVDCLRNGELKFSQMRGQYAKFTLFSWLVVGNGMKLFTKYNNSGYEDMNPSIEEYLKFMDDNIKHLPTSKEWYNTTNANFKI